MKIKENEKRDKYLDLVRETKKAMEYEGDCDTNYNWCTWNNTQRISKGAGGVRNQRMSLDHPNHSIVEVGQNTEKSPGDIRRLTFIQTPVKAHQLTLV